MTPEDFAPLEISRYELRLRAEEACGLPAFLGSTLRGAFGHALRQAVSSIDGCDCDGCKAIHPCSYHYLFETPVPPHVSQLRGQKEAPVPFILSPPVVQNPIKRVWRVPAARAAGAAVSVSSRQAPALIPNSQSEIRNSQLQAPRSANHNPQSRVVTSVSFPDQPRRFSSGDELIFDLTLIGRATEYLPHVILAMNGMARRGLGATRARFELREVFSNGGANSSEPIWANGVFLGAQASRLLRVSRPLSELIRDRLVELKLPSKGNSSCSPSFENTIADALRESHRGNGNNLNGVNGKRSGNSLSRTDPRPLSPVPRLAAPNLQSPSPDPYSLRLRLVTPTRIRVKGDLQTEISFELLVRNLSRRVSMLAAVHAGALELSYRELIERAKSVATRSSSLRWWDLERYTNRQNGKLKIGGMIGEVEYKGDGISEFMPLLVAGELLGIGTGTSFGLGRFSLECGGRFLHTALADRSSG